jgi:hypothetical protein
VQTDRISMIRELTRPSSGKIDATVQKSPKISGHARRSAMFFNAAQKMSRSVFAEIGVSVQALSTQ